PSSRTCTQELLAPLDGGGDQRRPECLGVSRGPRVTGAMRFLTARLLDRSDGARGCTVVAWGLEDGILLAANIVSQLRWPLGSDEAVRANDWWSGRVL